MNTTPNPSTETKPPGRKERSIREQNWRADVVEALRKAGHDYAATEFVNCGEFVGNFQVVACSTSIQHPARAVPHRCHLPFCGDCEQISHIRRVERYEHKFTELAKRAPSGWSLKHIILPHPSSLRDADRKYRYNRMLKFVRRFIDLVYKFAWYHDLSPDERRRGRADLMKHLNADGLPYAGALVGIEYGEKNHRLHAHLAIMLPYIPKGLHNKLWHQATYGEAHVAKLVKHKATSVKKIVQEVVKYATKPVELPPELAPNLLDVLQGKLRRSRRVRAYGALRTIKLPEKEPCRCKVCDDPLRMIRASEYLACHVNRNIQPDAEIVALAAKNATPHGAISLDLIRRAKAGEGLGGDEVDLGLEPSFQKLTALIRHAKASEASILMSPG